MSITMVMAGEDVCLPTIGALAEELKTAIAPDATVRLDLSGAASPDLSVIQLVQSARVSAAALGCDFALSAPLTRHCARCWPAPPSCPLRRTTPNSGFTETPPNDRFHPDRRR